MQVPESASAFLRAYVEAAVAQHPALLLPVKPNPREYKSPAKVSTYAVEIFMTANPALNLSQQAVALVCDVQSKDGAVPEEIRVSWQMLLRQIVQEGILTGMESAFEVRVNFLTQLLSSLSSVYFGMQPPRRQMDALSSMFSGMLGGSSADSKSEDAKFNIRQLPKPSEPSSKKTAGTNSESAPSTSEADQLVDDEMD